MNAIDRRIIEKIEDNLSFLDSEIEACKETIENSPWYDIGTIILNLKDIAKYTVQKEKYIVLRELFEE